MCLCVALVVRSHEHRLCARDFAICDHPPDCMHALFLQVLSWFTEGAEAGRAGLRVCRVKNKFRFAREELVGGYRDLMFCAIYKGPRPVDKLKHIYNFEFSNLKIFLPR